MSDKVVSIFSKKKDTENVSESKELETFEEVIKRNKETAERMKKDREKANKGVIRSYRLKL